MKTHLTGERWVTSNQKRTLDMLAAAALLPVAVPVGAVALGLSGVTEGFNPIFRQTRLGKNGQPFRLTKVKTMTNLQDGPQRITRVGSVLRPIAIDETPQLINILGGQMSLVGPRAAQEIIFDGMQGALDRNTYDEWLDAYCTSRPGGLSSFGIYHRSHVPAGEDFWTSRAQMDIQDFKNASLANDLRMIKKALAMGLHLVLPDLKTAEPDQAVRENSALDIS